jgi:hypothetical protein
MTISRTGSRAIIVDGVRYRWTVRDRPTYQQAIATSYLTVAIETEEAALQTLHLTLPVVRCDNWLAQPGYVVTPRDIARWIPLAIARGWQPKLPGSTFQIELLTTDLDGKRIRWPLDA